jgi:hypothetical protein
LQEFSFKNSANRMNKLGWVILWRQRTLNGQAVGYW